MVSAALQNEAIQHSLMVHTSMQKLSANSPLSGLSSLNLDWLFGVNTFSRRRNGRLPAIAIAPKKAREQKRFYFLFFVQTVDARWLAINIKRLRVLQLDIASGAILMTSHRLQVASMHASASVERGASSGGREMCVYICVYVCKCVCKCVYVCMTWW